MAKAKISSTHDSARLDRGIDHALKKMLGLIVLPRGFIVTRKLKAGCCFPGGYDLLVIVEGESIHTVADFVAAKLSSMANVRQTATHFLLRKYKRRRSGF